MASYTQNYQLHQWEAGDDFLRTDFNEDFAKIDAAIAGRGNCEVVKGTYVGTGKYGESNPNSLSLGRTPDLLFVGGSYLMAVVRPMARSVLFCAGGTNYYYGTQMTWTEDGVRWYHSSNAELQCNTNGQTYTYYAFFLKNGTA